MIGANQARRERKASLDLKAKRVSLAPKATRVNEARRVSQGLQGPPVLPDLPVPHHQCPKSWRHPNHLCLNLANGLSKVSASFER